MSNAVSFLDAGPLALTFVEKLIIISNMVTRSAILPGTTSVGMKKPIQEAATRIAVGR